MKRHWLLMWVLAPAVVAAGCATQPPAAKATDEVAQDTRCLRETGSRARRDGSCMASGRVITREEIERSGASQLGEALNRISPL